MSDERVVAWDVRLEIRRGRDQRDTLTFQTREVEDDHHVLSIGSSRLADVELPEPQIPPTACWLLVNDAGFTWVRDALTKETRRFGVDDRIELGEHIVRLIEPPVRAQLTWKVVLLVRDRGQPEPERRVFHGTPIVVGRTSDCQIALPDANVSRHHVCFEMKGDVLYVKDLGSSNGMHIDGVRYDRKVFELTDRLHVGNAEIQLAEPPVQVPA